MSQETILIEHYFDAFNHHDLEALMVAAHGRRIEGADAIRAYYASTFATFLTMPSARFAPWSARAVLAQWSRSVPVHGPGPNIRCA